jgi:DNA polymerase/3'-5' exonuclease PolX
MEIDGNNEGVKDMNLSYALEIAEKYRAILEPYCEEGYCLIAGSIRRRKPEVGDIELVVVPRGRDLIKFAAQVNRWFKIKGEPTGRYTKRKLDEGIYLDLFITNKKDYFRQFAIRTGSEKYSATIIAHSWVKKGWRGTEDGLRLEKECVQQGKKKWICVVSNPHLPPTWQSEEEFFLWLGVPYVSPERRQI